MISGVMLMLNTRTNFVSRETFFKKSLYNMVNLFYNSVFSDDRSGCEMTEVEFGKLCKGKKPLVVLFVGKQATKVMVIKGIGDSEYLGRGAKGIGESYSYPNSQVAGFLLENGIFEATVYYESENGKLEEKPVVHKFKVGEKR